MYFNFFFLQYSLFRFSFDITPVGEILRVYHPEENDDMVLATKKGFAALLSSKLHGEGEVTNVMKNCLHERLHKNK